MGERFTVKRHRDYIELLEYGKRISSCDNDKEIEEEIHNILGY